MGDMDRQTDGEDLVMNVMRGLVMLFVTIVMFGLIVVPTYISLTNTELWTSGGMAAMPGWMSGTWKLMPLIAIIGLIYGAYKYFANRSARGQDEQEPDRNRDFDWEG